VSLVVTGAPSWSEWWLWRVWHLDRAQVPQCE
jgi:hypothetical protein